ncbi:MAG: carbohydrate ABC transporter permease [Christensenellaceae bacterium]|nr:carbohydrate ABC transporter permease [Christensenellaceae bacterium]
MTKLYSVSENKPRSRVGYVMVYAVSFLVLLVILYPILVMLSVAFKDLDEIFLSPATWLPRRLMFENWINVFDQIPLFEYTFNSIKVVSLTIAFTLIVTVMAAYAFSKLDFYMKKTLMYLTMVLQMFSPVILIMPLFKMMSSINLYDEHMSLVLLNTTFCIPFVTFLIKGYFDIIPREVEEAAFIDGCSKFGVLMRIMMPLAKSGLAIAGIFTFILTWNEFLFAYTMISSRQKEMVVVALQKILKTNPVNSVQWNTLFVAAVYVTIPVTILFAIVRGKMLSTVTEGAIK